jgi:hypothetical protein
MVLGSADAEQATSTAGSRLGDLKLKNQKEN